MSNEASQKAAVLAVNDATRESRAAFIDASTSLGMARSSIVGLDGNASNYLQAILTEAIDTLLTKDHQPKAKFGKDDDGWASVRAARNDLYFDLRKRTREAGKAQYDWDKKHGCLKTDRELKPRNRSQYGKAARQNILNKADDIRNIFWSLQFPDMATDVRAILRPDANGVKSKWTEVSEVAGRVVDHHMGNTKVPVGHPVGHPSDIWLLRGKVSDYEWTEHEDGTKTTTIRWGGKDREYDTEIVLLPPMPLKEANAKIDAHRIIHQRAQSKAASDIKEIRAMVIPEEQLIPSSADNE